MTKLDRRRKGVFGPPMGKKFLIFCDDLGMPSKDTYGSQGPLELIRQWLDHGYWSDLRDTTKIELIDLVSFQLKFHWLCKKSTNSYSLELAGSSVEVITFFLAYTAMPSQLLLILLKIQPLRGYSLQSVNGILQRITRKRYIYSRKAWPRQWSISTVTQYNTFCQHQPNPTIHSH